MKLTDKSKFRELRNNINTTSLVQRIMLWYQLFPHGLTAPEVYRLDVMYFGSSNPEKSYRARISELSGPKKSFKLEKTARTKTGQYGEQEHYYKLRKL